MSIEKVLEYLKKHDMTIKALAIKCHLHPHSLQKTLSKGLIKMPTADKLDYFTRGEIPYDSMTTTKRPKKPWRRKGVYRERPEGILTPSSHEQPGESMNTSH